jgi:hypothetical protein
MKIQVSFKPALILTFLSVNIILNGLSIFLFSNLDHVVHGDLYNYGLQFSLEWAEPYWAYARLILGCLLISLLITAISIVLVLLYMKSRSRGLAAFSELSSVAAILLTCLSIFLYTRLDRIVHGDLYSYNLQFSYVWATKYWTYAGFMIGLQGLAILTAVTATMLILLSGRSVWRVSMTKLACFLMLSTGMVGLIFSVFYNSQILAFVGLGLVFWGATLAYVRGEESSKTVLLDAMSISPLIGLNQMLQRLGYEGDAVYLPPGYLKNPEANLICVSKQKNARLPTPEEIQTRENQATENSFILLTPPGNDLTVLFEKVLDTRFTMVDMKFVQEHVPQLFIDKLEIAEDVRMEIRNDFIRFDVESPTIKAVSEKTQGLAVTQSLGNPFSSAIACVLAKASGKLVKINGNHISQNGKIVTIEYSILEKPLEGA